MENNAVKTIGVLTSGGDAPGMNAAVRAVVRTALDRGIEVIGIRRGYNGLLSADLFTMDRSSVSDTISKGGTQLGTARCEDRKEAAVGGGSWDPGAWRFPSRFSKLRAWECSMGILEVGVQTQGVGRAGSSCRL